MSKRAIYNSTIVFLLIYLITILSLINNSAQTQQNWVWSPTELISTETTGIALSPDIAVDDFDNIHIVWFDNSNYNGAGTDRDIFYKLLNSSTLIWSETEVVSTESNLDSRNPQITTDSLGNPHIVWEDFTDYNSAGTDMDIFYKFKNETTGLWNLTTVVSTVSTGLSRQPSIAIDSNNNIHIMWEDVTDYIYIDVDFDVFYRNWNSSNSAWGLTEIITVDSTSFAGNVQIALDSYDNLYVVWEDWDDLNGSGFDQDIFFRYWNISRLAWSPTELVTNGSILQSSEPSLIVDNQGNVHSVWLNYNVTSDDFDIYYSFRNSSTQIWGSTEAISFIGVSSALNQDIAVDSFNDVHVVWSDEVDYKGAKTDRDIFYIYMNSSLGVWSDPELISSFSTSLSLYPSIAVDTMANLHVTWSDGSDFSQGEGEFAEDIFYKKGVNFRTVFKTNTQLLTKTQSVTITGPTVVETTTETTTEISTFEPDPYTTTEFTTSFIEFTETESAAVSSMTLFYSSIILCTIIYIRKKSI